MHDVLDPRDLVPDEAEQLSLSGHPVEQLWVDARDAAAADDRQGLARIEQSLGALQRASGWAYTEPDEKAVLGRLASIEPVSYDAASLSERIRGAWLGRTVGNTLGKPVEGLSRGELNLYLETAGQCPQTGYLPLLDPLPAGVTALHPSAPASAAGRFVDVTRDDDIDWTILGLHLLEKYGRGVTTSQIGAEWLDRVPFTQTYTAERAAYRNSSTV